MDPFGWRIAAAVVGSLMVLVMCRLARRMTGSTALGLRRRAAAEPRRPAVRAVPAGAARHLPGVLHPLRGLAAWSPTGTGTAPGWRGWCPDQVADPASYGPVRGLLFRPWLLASGVCWGLALGTKWTAIYPLAAFGSWSGCGAPARGGRSACAGRCCARSSPTASRRSSTSSSSAAIVYTATWTGWLVHADEYEKSLSSTQYTQFIKERPCTFDEDGEPREQPRQQRQALADGERARRPRPRRGRPVAAVAVVLPPGRLHLPHPLPELLRRTPTRPSRRAGCCSTGRSASPPTPASSRAPAAATRPRAAPA